MTYHWATRQSDTGGIEYTVQWKGKFDPIAVCDDYRDARRIVDALNAQEQLNNQQPSTKKPGG